MVVVEGEADTVVPPSAKEWKELTAKPAVHKTIQGGHYFISTHVKEVRTCSSPQTFIMHFSKSCINQPT